MLHFLVMVRTLHIRKHTSGRIESNAVAWPRKDILDEWGQFLIVFLIMEWNLISLNSSFATRLPE